MTDSKIRIPVPSDEELKALEEKRDQFISNSPHFRRAVDEIMKGDGGTREFMQRILDTPPGQIPLMPNRPDIGEILRNVMPPKPPAVPAKKQKLAREDQITKERCQTAAKLLWKDDASLTITYVAQHPNVYNTDITGGRNYDLRTVRDWVAEVFPKNQKKQVGRPPKKLK